MASIASLLDRFKLDCGRYPTEREGLSALIRKPASLRDRWQGPYATQDQSLDPWEHPYLYKTNGHGYTLMSLGADGKLRGEGDDADILTEG